MRVLREGIPHLEDLAIDEIIETLRNMSTMVAQEKLDGAQLWVGIDPDGKLFTSREGKKSNADRRYKPEDWPQIAVFNQFRAAHAALASKEQELRRVLQPGDTVEAEVLFGRQPNSVIYGAGGKSYIAFLRGVEGTDDKVAEHLALSLANQQAEAKFDAVDTADGKELSTRTMSATFQFTMPHKLDAAKLKQESGIEGKLKALEAFLKKGSVIAGLSNIQLATTSVTTIDKAQKAAFKTAKDELLTQLRAEFIDPIKLALLAKVSKKSGLAADDMKPEEDVGIEGIVLRDQQTGKQIKIVDRDVFTLINKFNQSTRGEIQSALNTTDPDAPLEMRGGLLGQMRIRFAEALGNRELAKAANVRKFMATVKGDTAEETVKNFAASLTNIDDFQSVKKKILAIASETYKELNDKLEEFKADHESYKLKLKNGKEISLSAETVKKTLLTFAEARKNLKETFDKIKETKTLAGLLAVLYGTAARAIHTELEESLLVEKQHKKHQHRKAQPIEISLADFNRKDTFHLVNSYLATVFMTIVIHHANDTIGMRHLRDRKNWQLKKHSADMSPFNHWGYAIWRAGYPDMEHHLTKATRAELVKITKKIPTPWWKYFHMDFSQSKELTIEWGDHRKMLHRLIDLSGVRSDRVNTLLDQSIRYPKLDIDEQRRYLKKLISYAHQFVPRSRLYLRLKIIMDGLKDETVAEGLLKRVVALAEDGEAGGAEVSVATNGALAGTAAGAIAPVETKLFGNRRTEMRRRNTSREFLALVRKYKDPRNYKDAK